MQFARRVNSVRPSVGRLLAATGVQQSRTDQAMLEENTAREVLYARQPHAVPDALAKRVLWGYQPDQILKYMFAVSVLITQAQRFAN